MQGWEESVDASISQLLRTCLAKSAKDQAVNPTPLTMTTDPTKLKKHIAQMCDRLLKGARLVVDGQKLGKYCDNTIVLFNLNSLKKTKNKQKNM